MDITKIIEAVVLVVIVPLLGLAVNQFSQWVKLKTSEQQRQVLAWAVRSAVLAVEQAGLTGDAARKEAISTATRILARQGLTADMHYLADLIEAEVFDQFNRFKDLEPISQPDYAWATVTGTLAEVSDGAKRNDLTA